jgi:hypothetical protein
MMHKPHFSILTSHKAYAFIQILSFLYLLQSQCYGYEQPNVLTSMLPLYK